MQPKRVSAALSDSGFHASAVTGNGTMAENLIIVLIDILLYNKWYH